MLGSCFLKHLAGSADFEMYATDKDELDVTSFVDLEAAFDRMSPDFVLNCAAYTDVDACETPENLSAAFQLNAKAPEVLAKVCKKHHAVLVHFSTDYVFDGENQDGYNEDSATSPVNVYGATKRAGEMAIEESMDAYYIVRTSWFFGENGKNFVDTMIKLGKECIAGERDGLRVVGDQIGSPTYTADLVRAVITHFLNPFVAHLPVQHEKNLNSSTIDAENAPEFGIYHLTTSGSCSWFEFAKEVFKVREIEVKVEEVNSVEFPRAAKRPRFSKLINNKTESLRDWREALKAYIG